MRFISGKPGIERIFGLPIAYEVSAGAVIFRNMPDKTWRFLLLRYRHCHWDFAKGHVEAGETLKEAARREIEEETGIADLRFVPEFHERTHFFYVAKGSEWERRRKDGRGRWIFKTVHFFLAENTNEAPVHLSDEHTDFLWLPFDKALEQATFENAKQLLRLADDVLSG